jgi:hypothetical protein
VDVAAGTVTIFGVEFRVGGTDSLRGLAVGDWVVFTAYANRFISAIGRATPNFYPVQVVGEFLDLSPPDQFTLRGVTDWIVQVTDAKFAYDWVTRLDGECYAIPVSAERFWELAAQPKPPGVTTVWAAGRPFRRRHPLGERGRHLFPVGTMREALERLTEQMRPRSHSGAATSDGRKTQKKILYRFRFGQVVSAAFRHAGAQGGHPP